MQADQPSHDLKTPMQKLIMICYSREETKYCTGQTCNVKRSGQSCYQLWIHFRLISARLYDITNVSIYTLKYQYRRQNGKFYGQRQEHIGGIKFILIFEWLEFQDQLLAVVNPVDKFGLGETKIGIRSLEFVQRLGLIANTLHFHKELKEATFNEFQCPN